MNILQKLFGKIHKKEPYLEIRDGKRILHMEHIDPKNITVAEYKEAMRIISGKIRPNE